MEDDRGWLLAFDLSTPHGVLAVEGPGGAVQREIAGDARASRLLVAAGEALSEAGIASRDLALVGVGRGPGSFTGVRIAVTAAKILAAVLDVPLVAPDSLAVTAAGAAAGTQAVFAALDARRGEVYHALFRMDDGYPVAVFGPAVAPPLQAASSLRDWMQREGAVVTGVGNGIQAYGEVWPQGMMRCEGTSPRAEGLVRLCRMAAGRGEYAAPLELLPLYLRRPDAGGRRAGAGEGSRC